MRGKHSADADTHAPNLQHHRVHNLFVAARVSGPGPGEPSSLHALFTNRRSPEHVSNISGNSLLCNFCTGDDRRSPERVAVLFEIGEHFQSSVNMSWQLSEILGTCFRDLAKPGSPSYDLPTRDRPEGSHGIHALFTNRRSPERVAILFEIGEFSKFRQTCPGS